MRRALLLIIALFLMGATPSPQLRAQRIEREVWSPYCPGQLLAECATTQARQLREKVLARVQRGESDAQIYAWLRGNYGDDILATPSTTGAGLVIWLVPLVAIVAGALLWLRAARKWRRAKPTEIEPTDDEYLRRVREDVRKGL